jgi:hypothetical protein
MTPTTKLSHKRRSIGIAAALLTVLVIATACEPRPYTAHYPQSPRVAVVGDSLVHVIEDANQNLLVGDGWNASVTGVAGFTIRQQFDMLSKLAPTNPQVAVIALGTNDLREIDGRVQTWEGLQADARQALRIVANVPCVVWVGVSETAGAFIHGTRHSTAGWAVNWHVSNELFRARPKAGTAVWADWAAVSRNNPGYFLSPDDMHHTAAGKAAYSQLIRDSVRKCPGNPIIGNLETVAGSKGAITVGGWVADPDAASTEVHVYTNGAGTGALTANLSRPDVKAAYPRFSGLNGFSGTFAMPRGTHRVCVYAINQGPPAQNPLMDCRTVTVS